MEERKLKRKNPRSSTNTAAPTGGSGRKNSGSSGGRHLGYSHNTGTHSSQKGKSRRQQTYKHSFLSNVFKYLRVNGGTEH